MPRQDRVGEIQRPSGLSEDVAVVQPGTGNLLGWPSNISQWVHFNFVIRIPSEINTHFVTIFRTPKGGFPINVSLPINERA